MHALRALKLPVGSLLHQHTYPPCVCVQIYKSRHKHDTAGFFFLLISHTYSTCVHTDTCVSSLHTYSRRGWERGCREVNNISELSTLMQWMHFDCQYTPPISLLPRSLFYLWHTITHQYLQCLSSLLHTFGHVLLLFSCLQMSEHLCVTQAMHFELLGFFDQPSVSSFPPPLSHRLLSPLKNFHRFYKAALLSVPSPTSPLILDFSLQTCKIESLHRQTCIQFKHKLTTYCNCSCKRRSGEGRKAG